MKRLILALLLCLVPYSTSNAQDPAVPAPVPATTAHSAPATPTATPAPVSGDKATVNNIVTDAKGVADAVKDYKDAQKAGDKMASRLALMALLAAIFKILLSALKFTSEFWKGKKGKLVLRLSTLVLGIGVTLLSHFAAGEDWMSAVMLGISGPLAISFHELFDIIVSLVQKNPAPEPGK